jgi:hypothetical protein
MIMTFEGYQEALEEQKKKEDDLKSMKEQMNEILAMIRLNPKLAKVKPEVLYSSSKL